MVICLESSADLHMAQLMPLPLTVSCFSKIQIDFSFLVPAHPGSHEQRAVKWVFVCVLLPYEVDIHGGKRLATVYMGDGVKNARIFVDVLFGWSLSKFFYWQIHTETLYRVCQKIPVSFEALYFL